MRFSALVFMMTVGVLTLTGALAQSAPESGEAGDAQAPAADQAQPERLMPGQQLPHWLRKAGQAYQRRDIEGWVEATEELHRLRPFNQDFMRHLVEGHAQLGNLSKAFNMMLKMQQQGLSENWDRNQAVAPMREHNLYDHLNQLMVEAGKPFGDVSTWSTLGSEYAMPEAMAVDQRSGRIFVGTVRDGLIIYSDDGEAWQTFASPDDLSELQGVFDLAIDEERGHLWVATGAVPQFQGEPREDGVNSSLLRLDLESGELQAEYQVSAGSGRNLLGSLALADDGTVYAADTQSPVVYRLDPGSESLTPFFGHQNFTSLRGIALNGDDSLLYIADYELGIFVVDVSGGEQAWQLALPDTLNAGGIDGLFWWDQHLIAIQNAITPQRVVRLKLGQDGLGVTAVAPLAAGLKEFDMPTFGVMDGQDLYFLAGSHWQHVNAEGEAASGDEVPEVPIMTIDVDNASVQVVGQEILDELKRQQEQRQEENSAPDPAPEQNPEP